MTYTDAVSCQLEFQKAAKLARLIYRPKSYLKDKGCKWGDGGKAEKETE